MRIARFIILLLFPILALQAQDDEVPPEHDVVVLSEGKEIKGDYFAVGKSIELSGTVTGDAYILATQAFIDGHVQGDVLVLGGSVTISGKVDGNIRALAGQVRVTGDVGHNVSVVAATSDFASSGNIGGDIVCLTGTTDLSSSIGYNATIVSSSLRVTGDIKNDMKAYAGTIRLTSKADVGGNFEYRSGSPAWIDPGATIKGEVVYQPTIFRDLLRGTWLQGVLLGSKLAAVFMNFIFTFVFGLIVLKLFPKTIPNSINAIKHHPTKALFYGAILLILFPLAALIFLMTILGAPFAITVIALNVITFYTVKIVAILWVSNEIFPKIGLKPYKTPTFALGLLIYFLLTLIPYVGAAMSFVALLFGLGSMVLTHKMSEILHPKSRPKRT